MVVTDSGWARLLRGRSFVSLLYAGALSLAAPVATTVVLIWSVAHAYPISTPNHVAYSALALAFLGLAATLPTLAAQALSGALADRFNRRRLMLAVNGVALLSTLAIAAVLVWDPESAISLPGPTGFYLPTWMVIIYPLSATQTVATTIFRPTFNASIPRLVPPEDLGNANGLVYANALVLSVVTALGVTGLILLIGRGPALLLPVVIFAATEVLLLTLRADLDAPERPPPRTFLWDAAEGYRYLWRNRALFEITVTALAINFFSAVAFVELGLYVTEWLGSASPVWVGALYAAASLGSAVGTLAVNRLGFERRAGRFLVLLTLMQGLAVVGLGLSHTIWVSVPVMFLFGVFPGMYTTVFLSTVQATVPNRLLGRVFAADEIGSYSMVPVGQYTGGVITIALSVQWVYLIAGIGTVGVGAVMAGLRDLRRLGFEPKGGAVPPEPLPSTTVVLEGSSGLDAGAGR